MKIEEEIAEQIQYTEFVADKRYDGDKIRKNLEIKGIKPTIPYRKNRKTIKEIDTESYKQRNAIERLVLKVKEI